MSRKIAGGLTGLLASLFAASQIVAEIYLPSGYRNWPVKRPTSHFGGMMKGMTYRPNEKPNAEVVGEYELPVILDYNDRVDNIAIPVTIIVYRRTLNPDPRLNQLEIEVKIMDENPEHDEKFLKVIDWKIRSYCKGCHNVPEFKYVGNFNIPKFVNTAL